MQENVCKKILVEFLSFLLYKVENDSMTMEEMQDLSNMFTENLNLTGSVDDFAKFYGKPRTNISSVINRRMIDKPKRRVMYSFNIFRKLIPDKWKSHR